jgi:REDY-like protein HapK
VTTMIVLVNLKAGVSPEDYERWVMASYAPAVSRLPSVDAWRNHRVGGLLGSDAAPPYRYVVTLGISDIQQLGRDMAGKEMQRLISELHGFAEVTQLMTERFV